MWCHCVRERGRRYQNTPAPGHVINLLVVRVECTLNQTNNSFHVLFSVFNGVFNLYRQNSWFTSEDRTIAIVGNHHFFRLKWPEGHWWWMKNISIAIKPIYSHPSNVCLRIGDGFAVVALQKRPSKWHLINLTSAPACVCDVRACGCWFFRLRSFHIMLIIIWSWFVVFLVSQEYHNACAFKYTSHTSQHHTHTSHCSDASYHRLIGALV